MDDGIKRLLDMQPPWEVQLREESDAWKEKCGDLNVKMLILEAEIEKLREALEMVMTATSYTTYPDKHPVWVALRLATKALKGDE